MTKVPTGVTDNIYVPQERHFREAGSRNARETNALDADVVRGDLCGDLSLTRATSDATNVLSNSDRNEWMIHDWNPLNWVQTDLGVFSEDNATKDYISSDQTAVLSIYINTLRFHLIIIASKFPDFHLKQVFLTFI